MESHGSSVENTATLAYNHFCKLNEEIKPLSEQAKGNEQSTTIKEDDANTVRNSTEFATLVAAHYNSIKDCLSKRDQSRILYLRNFNNWIKSVLISEYATKFSNSKVLDMCCGKGGDIFKWLKNNVRYIIFADIAEKSIEECKNRVQKDIKVFENQTVGYETIVADCTRVNLREKYSDSNIQLDIVSCQFSFHYCFESLPQAECMLRNVSQNLKVGGFFIGTLPNAFEIVKRLKQLNTNCIKNDIFSLEMCCSEPYPLFGAKYNFHLDGVVNCPEFLVHFPSFEKLASQFGLKLVKAQKFSDFFHENKKDFSSLNLLKRMKALETYLARCEKNLKSHEYLHAKKVCEDENLSGIGTLSKSEWEVISLYQIFVFQKIK